MDFEAAPQARSRYAARCNVLREERHLRALLISSEEQAWCELSQRCSEAYGLCVAHEERERRRQSLDHKQPYTIQFHRNPNSPMPTLESIEQAIPLATMIEGTAASFSGASSADPESDLLLWEGENRQDLQAWEKEERYAMARVMSHIVAKQLQHERREREEICRGVLGGATVLEWESYPSY